MMLRQVQYFHAVVRTGSLTEAAEECFESIREAAAKRNLQRWLTAEQ